MIRVLVVDDSETFRVQVTLMLESDAEINVVGWAATGRQAFDLVGRVKPDIVTMDALMPDLDGVEATDLILRSFRVPIIIVSSVAAGHYGVRALGAGAVEALAKPTGAADLDRFRSQLLQSVKLLSEVPILLRRGAPDLRTSASRPGQAAPTPGREVKVVAIGASTGGPGVIFALFQSLPPTFRPAILVAQHVSEGFDRYLVDWWAQAARRRVELADSRRALAPGTVVVAPAKQHLVVTEAGDVDCRCPKQTDPFVPSIDSLFHSVAATFGSAAIGLLLSGMGDDGAAGLLAMRSAGAMTAVQEPSSAIVGSMPTQALLRGGATTILRPEEISTWVGGVTTPL
jgi:two-component system, chemotaxis family, protein-glutamate methylesterase/glutaminase